MSTISSSCLFINSNLQNFLQAVTPIVNHNNVTEVEANHESRNGRMKLQDIWRMYDEWSYYGVGVPVLLESGENVVQYYAPLLSAIQIFMKKPTSTSSNEENGFVALQYDSSSDDDATAKSNNGFCKDNLYVNFFETCSPYLRMPFSDKILELAESYPGLLSFYINDIAPASWMSIAWYPIYQMPQKIIVSKDLETCFLTYHTLSNSFKAYNNEEEVESTENRQVLDLSPFGLTTYKMLGDVWNCHQDDDEKIQDFESAASSWLSQLNIHQHDYNFFTQ
ncbi:hypothetical protein CTI12_AA595760 [Artemisia annua]|uniref:Uncharacterized protein n=1 Tax=Artemisia annua TaxID=35608 RepID=A0A2U1KJB6_ARTAN|nr:hypothetical protein CTI12_AA595760 [Artemisia annua]